MACSKRHLRSTLAGNQRNRERASRTLFGNTVRLNSGCVWRRECSIDGLKHNEAGEAGAVDIICLAGIENISIAETIGDAEIRWR